MAKHWLFVGALVIGGAVAWAILGPGEHPEKAFAATKDAATKRESSDRRGELQVDVVKPTKGGLERVTMQPGSVISDASADLYAKVSGYLKQLRLERKGQPVLDDKGQPILVDIGTIVEKGDVLAVIDMPELEKEVEHDKAALEQAKATVFQMAARLVTAKADLEAAVAEIEQAKATLEEAKGNKNFREKRYDRIERLVNQKAVELELLDEQEERRHAARSAVLAAEATVVTSKAHVAAAKARIEQAQADLKEAEANVAVAEATLERAEVNLDYATITSPYSGVITARNYFPGDFIRSAEQGAHKPLLSVEKTDVMRVVLQVPDKDVPYTQPGDEATVEIDALPGKQFTGNVSRVSNAEDPQTRTMRTEVDLPNESGQLREGMYGKVTVRLQSASEALRLPSSCLVGDSENGKATLFVVRQGVAHKVPVRIGTDNGLEVEVLSGIGPNDEVVSSKSNLSDGVRVTVNRNK